MTVHWVRQGAGKWHAWPQGQAQVSCGALRATTLRCGTDLEIRAAVPPEDHAVTCTKCRRRTVTAPVPAPVADSARAQAWAGYIQRHLTHVHAHVKPADVRALAELLAEVGPPEQPEAQAVWDQIRTLLLTPWFRRSRDRAGHQRTTAVISHLNDALAHLPPHSGALEQVATALRTWQAVTGRGTGRDRFRADVVVSVMRQVPDVEPYVRHLQQRGLEHLAAVFHPNTLERAKREAALRGTFHGGGQYWTDTQDQLTIITE